MQEIQFQISLLNMMSQGQDQRQAEELENLLAEQETASENR